MRTGLLIIVLTALTIAGCREEKLAYIRFCSDIRASDPCIGEETVFIKGYYVWAQLVLSPRFNDTEVTGKLYGYQDGKRVHIESVRHELVEGQHFVMESMYFNMEGKFEVEFTDSKGNLLDKKGFEVW